MVMHWNDVRLRNKMLIGFSIVLLLLVGVGYLGYSGVGSVAKNAEMVIRGNQLDAMLTQREVDHLNWMGKVNELWINSQIRKIDVQTDDRLCSFGKWLYGPERRQMVSAYPELDEVIRQIEIPHRRLHASVVEMNEIMGQYENRNQAMEKVSQIMMQKTRPALSEVQALLHDIQQTAAEQIMSDEVMLAESKSTRKYVLIISGIAILTGIFLSFLISASISNHTQQILDFVERLAKGDFTQTLLIRQKDEIGRIADSLNRLVHTLGSLFREFSNGVISLNASSNELSTISDDMNKEAETTSGKARTVAKAAEEMSANMNNVAAASEEASSNVGMVSASTEEMNSTVQEIAKNSEQSRDINHEAVTQAESSSRMMDDLGKAADQISQMTEVISEISAQTNLLALNATIEAARAGEAGKGFSVVAAEIKDLAGQTARATVDIKERIENIQSTTRQTVGQIEKVKKIINDVNEIGTTIAAAVEEQSVATREIAINVSEAAQGISEVSETVATSASVTQDIAQDIGDVNRSAGDMAANSSQVHISAVDLQKLAGRLNDIIVQFKISEPRFDIGKVKSAHLSWRSRLEGLLHGKQSLALSEVADHHECEFGKWYDGPEGQALNDVPVFSTVGEHHANVHAYARKIVDLYHRGEKREASELMVSFEKERTKLFEALDALYLT